MLSSRSRVTPVRRTYSMLANTLQWSCLALALPLVNAVAQDNTTVQWSSEQYAPHFADINGDGVSDVLLQAKGAKQASSVIFGVRTAADESVHYGSTHQMTVSIDLTHAALTWGDFNGDSYADLWVVIAEAHTAQVYWGSAQGLSAIAEQTYSVDTFNWLTNASDFAFYSGDFNGDGRADVLAVSAQKNGHFLMHADSTGGLGVVQEIKSNVAWGKNTAEKLLIQDFNGDGKDDIVALAKKKHQSHYVVYADGQGLLTHKNTHSINAQLAQDNEDWNAADFAITAGFIDNEPIASLVKFNNTSGGIDENGVIVPGDTNNDKPHKRYSPANSTSGTTQSLLGVPATPTSYPSNEGNSYKPINITYNILYAAVTGATYYEVYESPNDSNYQQIYSGSALSTSMVKYSYGYQYYKYAACNASGCSGLSPWSRFYIYTAPGTPNNFAVSPSTVNTNVNYTLSWTAAGGSVDGTVYSLYESLNGGSDTVVYNVTRISWTDPGYSFSTSQSVGGSYRYRVRGCSPSAGCGYYATIYQTVIAPNTAPVAYADEAWVNQGAFIYINVLNNDSDAEGQALAPDYYTYPSHGTVTIANNMLLYTPYPSYSGSDSFYYQARDSSGLYSNAALVTITVNAVLSAPTLSRLSSPKVLDYELAWTMQSGASHYELYEQKNNASWTLVYSGPLTSMLFTQPIVGNYNYRIRACDSGSTCSGWSATMAAMRLKSTYLATDTLGTPVLRSQPDRSTEKAQYSQPYGQQENKQ